MSFLGWPEQTATTWWLPAVEMFPLGSGGQSLKRSCWQGHGLCDGPREGPFPHLPASGGPRRVLGCGCIPLAPSSQGHPLSCLLQGYLSLGSGPLPIVQLEVILTPNGMTLFPRRSHSQVGREGSEDTDIPFWVPPSTQPLQRLNSEKKKRCLGLVWGLGWGHKSP